MDTPRLLNRDEPPWSLTFQADRVLSLARELAGRLFDPHMLDLAKQRNAEKPLSPDVRYWDSASISNGDVGLAILCAYLDQCFPEEQWDSIGHRYLQQALEAAQQADNDIAHSAGLFRGISGIAFAATLLSRNGTRYQRALRHLNAHLSPFIDILSDYLLTQQTAVMAPQLFDCINGVSGILAYLLSIQHTSPEVQDMFTKLLAGTISLAHADGFPPKWYTPASVIEPPEWAERYPDGWVNCGLAHGGPGMLAILALCKLHGETMPGLNDAIQELGDLFLLYTLHDHFGITWPYVIGVHDLEEFAVQEVAACCGWCYGAPGVARALWLAGSAINNDTYCDTAIEAMQAVYRKPSGERGIPGPGFCHGISGLLQITLRFAHDTHLPFFSEAAEQLLKELLDLYDPQSLLGFREDDLNGNLIDAPGLLRGTAGIALVLLAASSGKAPFWDRLFLLA